MAVIDMRPQVAKDNQLDSKEVKKEPDLVEEQSTADKPDESSETTKVTGKENQPETSDSGQEDSTLEEAPKEVPKKVIEPEVELGVEKPETLQTKISALKRQEEELRKQIVELRGERRMVKSNKVNPENENLIVSKAKEQELSDVAEEDIKLIEKVLKAKGYVRKEDVAQTSYQEKLDMIKEDWLQKHSEYLPENDADDIKWNKLNDTLNSYFKAPSNPKDLAKVLDLAHQMINGNNREVNFVSKASIDASKEKIKTSVKGSSGNIATSPKLPSTNRKVNSESLIGFSEEEIKEMFN